MVLSIGEILADMIGNTAENSIEIKAFIGGAPFNVAVNCLKAGSKVGFCGRVGKTHNKCAEQQSDCSFVYNHNNKSLTIEGTGAITETHTLATDAITDPLVTAFSQIQSIDNPEFIEGEIEGIDDQGKEYALNIVDFITKASTGYYF